MFRVDASWGLSRLSQDDPLSEPDPSKLDFTYDFKEPAGQGVDIYIIGEYFTYPCVHGQYLITISDSGKEIHFVKVTSH